MRHVTSFPLHIDLEEGSKLRQSRKKIQKRFFGELPPRIISVQTRRNRSSDRFNLPDSRTPGRRGGAISWRSREQEKKKVRRDSLIVGVIRSFHGTTEQMHRLCAREAGSRGESGGGSPCLLGLFSVDYPAGRGVNTADSLPPTRKKSALLVGRDGISRVGLERMVGSTT